MFAMIVRGDVNNILLRSCHETVRECHEKGMLIGNEPEYLGVLDMNTGEQWPRVTVEKILNERRRWP